MSASPNFASVPRSNSITVSTANTAFDGNGTMSTVMHAGTAGTRIDQIIVTGTGTTSACLLNLFVSSTTGANTASNTQLVRSIAVTAVTASTTTAPFSAVLSTQTNPDLLPLFLPAGYTLRAAPTVAQTIAVTANGADF